MNEILNILNNKMDTLTEKQIAFVDVHTNIVSSGVAITNSIIVLAENLKRMRDEELYKEAGFDTFEEYSEKACGLKRSQAYKYINVLENLGSDFVHSSGQIGITKLSLLSSLSEEEREVIQAEVNVSDVSVTELKDKIKKLTEDLNSANKKFEDKDISLNKANEKIKNLNLQIKELKSNVKVEEKIIDNPEHLKKIDSLERLINDKDVVLNQKDKLLQDYKAQRIISNSSELTEFKILFEQTQANIQKMKVLLNAIPEEKKTGCAEALKKVGEMLC